MQLATEAIHIERNILKENVGSQDQVVAAIGGFNKIAFNKDGDFEVTPITLSKERLQFLQDHLMLYFTGFVRFASEVAKAQIESTANKRQELTLIQQMVDEVISILNSSGDLTDFGEMLHEAWALKRSLTEKISNSQIDEIYEAAREAGAVGGKLLGAGGGGFMLLFARPENQPSISRRLQKLLHVPFRFENHGSQIVVYEPDITPRY
jgi:D-glycero-alpha-D-manno-heptose-7-phosphate kinase